MKLSTLFIITTVVTGLFGLGFVLVPGTVYDMYDIDMNFNLRYTSQLLGAAFLGFAAIAWMARHSAASHARDAIVTGFFVADALGFVLALINQLNDAAVSMGWLNVIIYGLFAAGYGYFLFMKKEAE
jgi:hypothetical protein